MEPNIPKTKEEHYEQVRQELWYYLQDEPTPISVLASDMKMARQTLENFVYTGEKVPDTQTIFRVKRFLEEQKAKRGTYDQHTSTTTNEDIQAK